MLAARTFDRRCTSLHADRVPTLIAGSPHKRPEPGAEIEKPRARETECPHTSQILLHPDPLLLNIGHVRVLRTPPHIHVRQRCLHRGSRSLIREAAVAAFRHRSFHPKLYGDVPRRMNSRAQRAADLFLAFVGYARDRIGHVVRSSVPLFISVKRSWV